MSAECGKCGSDIVYPAGTWPLGVCPNCTQADRIKELETAVEGLLAWAKRYRGGDSSLDPEEWYIQSEYASRLLKDHEAA